MITVAVARFAALPLVFCFEYILHCNKDVNENTPELHPQKKKAPYCTLEKTSKHGLDIPPCKKVGAGRWVGLVAISFLSCLSLNFVFIHLIKEIQAAAAKPGQGGCAYLVEDSRMKSRLSSAEHYAT